MRSRIQAKLVGSLSRVWRRGLVVVLCVEYRSCRVRATSLVRVFYMLLKVTSVVCMSTSRNEEEGEGGRTTYTLFDGTPSGKVGRVSTVRC